MAIKDLQARQGNVNLSMEIVEKGEVREFEKFGKKGRVCNAVGKDDTGTIKLTLWNDDIDTVTVGDSITIENGWVGEWQGELQLSTGKFGKIAVTKSQAGESAESSVSAVEADVVNGQKKDSGEHILTKDEKVEEEVLEELNEKSPIEEEVTDDEKPE